MAAGSTRSPHNVKNGNQLPGSLERKGGRAKGDDLLLALAFQLLEEDSELLEGLLNWQFGYEGGPAATISSFSSADFGCRQKEISC